MVTRPETAPAKAPVTLTDFITAIRAEAAGRLNDRQLDALAEHLYHVPWLSELPLADAKLLLGVLEGWRRQEAELRQHRKETKEKALPQGAA